MATWEYQTIKVPFTGGWEAPTLKPADFDALLNRHGQDGWELVTIFTTHQENGRSGEAFATFKRSLNQ